MLTPGGSKYKIEVYSRRYLFFLKTGYSLCYNYAISKIRCSSTFRPIEVLCVGIVCNNDWSCVKPVLDKNSYVESECTRFAPPQSLQQIFFQRRNSSLKILFKRKTKFVPSQVLYFTKFGQALRMKLRVVCPPQRLTGTSS